MKINLIGKNFGRWLVVKESEIINKQQHRRTWLCQCRCGNQKNLTTHVLTSGISKSCGCLQKEESKNRMTTHGMRKTKLYFIWSNMKQRCQSTNKNYGGKGIKVCDEWQSFNNFKNWAIETNYSNDLSIERKNNSLGYNKNNCIWIPKNMQSLNRSNVIIYNGENAKQASIRLGGNIALVSIRLKRGWPIDKSFTKVKKI